MPGVDVDDGATRFTSRPWLRSITDGKSVTRGALACDQVDLEFFVNY